MTCDICNRLPAREVMLDFRHPLWLCDTCAPKVTKVWQDVMSDLGLMASFDVISAIARVLELVRESRASHEQSK